MNLQLLKNIKNQRYIKYIILLGALLLVYMSYGIYVWTNTESTDNAYVDADISIVSCEVSGVIDKILVQDNIRVKKGDIIAEILDADYRANLDKALADIDNKTHDTENIKQQIQKEQINLEKNKEQVTLANTNLLITDRDLKRISELSKDNFASKKLLDDANYIFDKAKSDLSQKILDGEVIKQNLLSYSIDKLSKEANLKSLIQVKNLAQRALDNTIIRAPIDGIVANSGIKIGNYVRAGNALLAIVPDKMFIKANFKETQIGKLLPGMKVDIKFDLLPKKKVIGTIRSVSPATGSKFSLIPPDNATGNFTKIVQRVPVLVDFELFTDTSINLVPGMSAQIDVRTDVKR